MLPRNNFKIRCEEITSENAVVSACRILIVATCTHSEVVLADFVYLNARSSYTMDERCVGKTPAAPIFSEITSYLWFLACRILIH